MKIPFVKESPLGLYLIAAYHFFGGVVGIGILGSEVFLSGLQLFAILLGVVLAVGLLYHNYYVWVLALLLQGINLLIESLRFIVSLFALSFTPSNLMIVVISAALLYLSVEIISYLNSTKIRALFGLAEWP